MASAPAVKVDEGLESTISDLVRRASWVSAPLIRSVADGNLCTAALFTYFSSVITAEEDRAYIADPFFRGKMCDNMLLQAGIAVLVPRPNVMFLGTAFYPWLFRSVSDYNASIEEGNGFFYRMEPYNMLTEATSVFQHLPTIILPINYSLHWGYVIVIPDLESGGAMIMWGDSLRYSPPKGLLKTVRLYLLLLYRGASFAISKSNHALDVLGLERQRDGFSCGFYVLDVMSRFSTASSDEQFPVRRFEVYDRATTEKYREVCIRSYVLHIRCVTTSLSAGKMFGVVEVSNLLRAECRKVCEAANAGILNMYPGMAPDKMLLLQREDSCIAVTRVISLDGTGKEEGEEGIVSKVYTGDGRKPIIRTYRNSPGTGSLSFGDIVDLGTIWNPADKNVGGNPSSLSPAPQKAAVEKSEVVMTDVVPNTIGLTARTEGDGQPQSSSVPISALCNEAMPEIEENKEGVTEPIMTCDLEDVCHNIFAYLAKRLSEGHLLRKPEYQEFKGGDFRFRLRLRCRFYDTPPKYSGTRESYQRCPVRIYARLLKNFGGWRVSFRHRHNHAIAVHARLRDDEVVKRLKGLHKSLKKHYQGAEAEFNAWQRGERFLGSCPAIDGSWNVPINRKDSHDDIKDPDPVAQGGKVSSSYTAIAPRPVCGNGAPELLERPIVVVSDCGLGTSDPTVRPGSQSEIVPLCVEYSDTLRKYVQGCAVSSDGRDVKNELKYFSECFGFPMVVRTSQHFHSDSDDGHVPPQVRRLTFRCPVGENNRLKKECKYWFTVVSAATKFVHDAELCSDGDSVLLRPLVINFRERWHTHEPDDVSLRRSLPAEVWRDAVTLKDRSLIGTGDIVRYLEDHYNLRVDRKVLSRKLRWEMGKRHPAERDCQRLVSNLLRYMQLNPGMFCEARINRENALHSVCWGFPQWRDDYGQFGIIPGVTIDAKALANNYDTPLAFICGRTNNGAVTIFFMGFLASQREEEFLWLLDCFKNFVNVPPRLVACDQDSAIINSVERVFPSTLVILDDWHLSKNQLKNSTSLAKLLGDTSRSKEISKALWGLRESRNESEFMERRRLFEEEYLRELEKPRWFVSLYHTNYKLVVLCYNRSTCGERFLFQGSGYAEAANSQYRRIIMDRKVPMARVPEEVLRYMEKRVSERRSDLRTTKFSGKMASISVSQLGFNKEEWERVVSTFVPYAWDIVTKQSISLAHLYTVEEWDTAVHECYGEVLSFKVVHSGATNSAASTRSYTVVCPKNCGDLKFIPHMCTCHWSNSSGLPCRHASRVATVYREYSDSGRFPLELMFHYYWRQDGFKWSNSDVIRARLGTLNHLGKTIVEEGNTENVKDEEERKKGEDRLRSVLWNNGHSVWNQMHRRVSRKGVDAMRNLDRLMSLLFEEVARIEGNQDLDIGLITQRLKDAVDRDGGMGLTATRRLEIWNGDEGDTNRADIKNSQQGVPKGRGTLKRARSWTETPKGNKRTEQKGEKNGKGKGKGKGKDPKRKVQFLLNDSASQPVQSKRKRTKNIGTLTQ